MAGALMNAQDSHFNNCTPVEVTNTTGVTTCATKPVQNFTIAVVAQWSGITTVLDSRFVVNGTSYSCGAGGGCSISVPIGTESVQGSAVIIDQNHTPISAGTFQARLYYDPRHRSQCKRGCQAGTKRPVVAFTGELWYDRVDFSMAGPFGLQFERFYDNQSTYSGDLGAGWRHTWDANIDTSMLSANYVAYFDRQDVPEYFAVKSGQSQFDNFSGDTLTMNGSGATATYTLQQWHGETDVFDSSGNMTSRTDRIGNAQTILRDSASGHNDRITRVTDTLGRSLCFYYDSSNRITGLVNWFSTAACPATKPAATLSMSFTYDGSNNLATVKEPDSKTWTYTYATTTSFPHNLLTVVDPNNNDEEINTYTNNQVATQWTGAQSANPKPNFLQFTYSAGHTTVVDGLSRSSTFSFDAVGNLTQVSGPFCNCAGGQSQSFTYDQFLRMTSSTDGDGSTHTITYAHGRDVTQPAGSQTNIVTAYPGPTQIVEPLSSGVNRTTSIAYYPGGDPRQDLPNVITMPSADTPGNSLTVTDTFLTTGLLTSEARQGYIAGVSTTYTTSFSYDSRGRLQQVTGPRTDLVQKWVLGYFSDTDTDFARRGQLQTITDPLNHVTTLASDISPNNTYSVFGMPLSSTDPNSGGNRLYL
jgi:YD repeat-containing protein